MKRENENGVPVIRTASLPQPGTRRLTRSSPNADTRRDPNGIVSDLPKNSGIPKKKAASESPSQPSPRDWAGAGTRAAKPSQAPDSRPRICASTLEHLFAHDVDLGTLDEAIAAQAHRPPHPRRPTWTPPSETFGERMERAMRLVSAYSWATGVSEDRVRNFTHVLLDCSRANHASPGLASSLNADGAPLQLCVTLSRNRQKYRLIADPASDARTLDERHARAFAALGPILASTGSMAMSPIVRSLLDELGPVDDPQHNKFPHGVFWVGASADSPGLALYVDGTLHPQRKGWERLDAWLGRMGEAMSQSRRLFERVRPFCRIASVGLEGVDPARYRYKVYMHASRDLPRGLLAPLLPRLHEFSRSGCFHNLLGSATLAQDEVLFNVGIHPATGTVCDAKIDFSTAAMGLRRTEITAAVDQCCERLGLRTAPLSTMAYLFNLDYSYVGMGIDEAGEPRLNVYFKSASS